MGLGFIVTSCHRPGFLHDTVPVVQFLISQLPVNMVKTVLGEVNKVERGLFKLFCGSIATRSHQSSHHRMEYLRVFSPCLDREKRWYISYSKLPFLKPSKFSKRVVFENFSEEVRILITARMASLCRRQCGSGFRSKYKANLTVEQEVYLVTSFGLYIGLVNHKNTLEVSKEFDFFRVLLNTSCLDYVRAKTSKMPAKSDDARAGVISATPPECPTFLALKEQLVQQEKFIHNLQRNLDDYREKIQTLEAELRGELAKPSSFRATDTRPHDGRATLKEISENDLLTPVARKRRMNVKASSVFKELEDVAERHRESLASNLGHLACCEKKPEARDLLRQIVDLIAEEKGVKKAVRVILSDDTFHSFMQSMAVPDWVLLYFKISARLPDGAWQLLLNLTKLGDTKVIKL